MGSLVSTILGLSIAGALKDGGLSTKAVVGTGNKSTVHSRP